MQIKFIKISAAITGGALLALLTFQNCTAARFTEVNASGTSNISSLGTADPAGNGPQIAGATPAPGPRGNGSGPLPPLVPPSLPSPLPSPGPSPILPPLGASPTPTPGPSPVATATPPGNSGDPHGRPQNRPTDSNLVECELGGASQKIASKDTLIVAQHSNATSDRICMSENACLNLINSYVAQRDCALVKGAPTTASSPDQCTSIFPGSRGTCKQATVLSDTDIAALLITMGQ
jgi:hypothetical protein